MTYTKKLSSPKWQRKRLEILQRDEFTCQLCNDKETELHVHHKKYLGEPWEADNANLITLCAHCHSVESIGMFNKIFAVSKRKQYNGSYYLCVIGDDVLEGLVLSIFLYNNKELYFKIGFSKDSFSDLNNLLNAAEKLL